MEVREIEIILPFNRTSAKAEQHISPIAQWLGIAVRLPAPVSFVVASQPPYRSETKLCQRINFQICMINPVLNLKIEKAGIKP